MKFALSSVWCVLLSCCATWPAAAAEPAAARPLEPVVLTRKPPGAAADYVHDISDFALDANGRFGVLHYCCDDAAGTGPPFVVVDADGGLVREIPVPPAAAHGSYWSYVAWLAGDDWLVAISQPVHDAPTALYRVDASTGAVTPLVHLVGRNVASLAALPNGGFVALTSRQGTESDAALIAWDAQGHERWRVTEDDPDSAPFSPEAVATTSTGDVVVLDNVKNVLQVYDRNGRHRRTVHLEDVLRGKPRYLSELRADENGGVLLGDFEGSPSLVRMGANDQVIAAFTPRYRDGRRFETHGDVQRSAAGAYWTSDGAALLRLDARGVVDRVIGAAPDATVLGHVAAVAVTPRGGIYAVDQRTGTVHVFDAGGRPLRIARPDPRDYAHLLRLPRLSVSAAGDVIVTRNQGSWDGKSDFLHYDARGKRRQVLHLELNEVDQTWLFQPGTSRRWVIGYERVYLVARDGTVLRRIERDADGRPLETPDHAAVAQDGSIAVVSAPRAPGSTAPGPLVTRYAANGDALSTWPAPERSEAFYESMAYDGAHFAFVVGSGDAATPGTVVVTDVHGARLLTVPAPMRRADTSIAVFFVTRDATPQLWVFDGVSRFARYALPWQGN